MTALSNTIHPSLIFRPAQERFHSSNDWLDSWHSFSFAGHHHPNWMGYGPLRVINDDTIAAGRGFGKHSHRDMEIITVMIEGEIKHQDSVGNSGAIQAGDVQRMSAGTGITHSEINTSTQACRLLQIWIEPFRTGLTPSYEQQTMVLENRKWTAVLDPNRSDCMAIAQSTQLWRILLEQGESISLPQLSCTRAWIQMINGTIALSDATSSSSLNLHQGDGIGLNPIESGLQMIHCHADQTDLLLFAFNQKEPEQT